MRVKLIIIALAALLIAPPVFAASEANTGAKVESQKTAAQLNEEGLEMFRANKFEEARATFAKAFESADPDSMSQFDAAYNILLPLRKLNDPDALWNAQRRVALMENKKYNKPIPAEFDAETRQQAMEKMKTMQAATAAAASPAPSAIPTPPPAPTVDKELPLYKEAVKLYSEHKWPEAATKLLALIKGGNDVSELHYYLGQCYQQMHKLDDAAKQYDWAANHGTFSEKRQGAAAARSLANARAGICPGQCLKANDPGWHHIKEYGPKHLFLTVPFSGGAAYFSDAHVGEVVKWVDGRPRSGGKCPICGGTGHVAPLK